MSSPNEPGPPAHGRRAGQRQRLRRSRTTVGPGGAGAGESGDVPPWQRGAGRRPGRRSRRGARARAAAAAGTSAGHSPGADARLNRFIAGGPAPGPARERRPPASGDRRGDAPRDAAPAREPRARESDARGTPSARSRRPRRTPASCPTCPGLPRARAQRKPGGERTAAGAGDPAPRRRHPGVRRQPRQQGPVRASMQIRRLDPWSVLKVSLVLSVALFFVWMIAVAFLYLVLGGMGVWSKLNSNVGDLLTSASGSGGELVSSGTIFGGAALIGLVNIVLLTAMATCGAFIYNLTTDLVGGVEVTLADRD